MAQSKEMCKNCKIIVGGVGRPFTLGMLYNAPKDELIQGLALWDSQTLQSLTVSQHQRSSHIDITTSDSTKDTSFNLNVDPSMKLNFLSGLIEVGGSANYLKDKKESKKQCRVTLQYKATTRFEQLCLTAAVCEKIESSEITEKGLATHVVTAIEYGANAFFVFDSENVEASDLQTVKDKMTVAVQKIPSAIGGIHGEGQVDLTEEEKSLVKTFSVKFYGDFLLESNPATFDAAVQTYVTLPKLLMGADSKNPEYTVPVKVTLLPLEIFTHKPAPVTKGISVGLVLEAEDTLQELHSITMRCNDCLSVSAVGKFPQLQRQLQKFHKLCHYYSVELQRQMGQICPAIREGTETESTLRRLFDQKVTSPFSQDKLDQWLEDKEREINVIQSCLDIMEGMPVLSTQAEVDKVVLAPGEDIRWGYTFTSLYTPDAQLEAMAQYLNDKKLGKPYEVQPTESAEVQWFYDDEVVKLMRQKAVNYQQTKDEFIQFITARDDKRYTGAFTYKYENGILVDTWQWEPAAKPAVSE